MGKLVKGIIDINQNMLGKRKINYTFCIVHIKIYKKGVNWIERLYVVKTSLNSTNLSLFRVHASL